MKKIEAVIRTEKLEDLKVKWADNSQITGMTVSQVLGFGEQKGFKEYIRGRAIQPMLLARVKVEIICTDNLVDQIVEDICQAAYTGEAGDGKIFISPIERVIKIRTGQEERD
ncbi:P-II family nitrogen regulator [Streptococcaceae bacterium ESL0729]|nr:P-II family nitrogen regulator [Streptococcaceae bacterium ESL0729]